MRLHLRSWKVTNKYSQGIYTDLVSLETARRARSNDDNGSVAILKNIVENSQIENIRSLAPIEST